MSEPESEEVGGHSDTESATTGPATPRNTYTVQDALAATFLRRAIEKFRRLKCFGDEERSRILPVVERAYATVFGSVWRGFVELMAGLLVYVALGIGGLMWLGRRLASGHGTAWIWMLLGAAFAVLLLVGLPWLFGRWFGRVREPHRRSFWLLVGVLAGWGALQASTGDAATHWWPAACALCALSWTALWSVGLRAAPMVAARFEERLSVKYPDAFPLVRTARALVQVCEQARVPAAWGERRRAVNEIEAAACAIEAVLDQECMTGSSRTDLLTLRKRIVAALRALQVKCLLPGEVRSRDDVVQQLRLVVVCLADGRWGDLPQKDFDTTAASRWGGTGRRVLSAVLAASPAMVVLALLQSSTLRANPMVGNLVAIGWTWVGMSVLAGLRGGHAAEQDPIETIRQLRDVVSGGK